MQTLEISIRKLWKQGHFDDLLRTIFVIEKQGCVISQQSAYFLLKVCIKKKDLTSGRKVRSLIERSGLDSDLLLGDHLIRLFASCGSILEAEETFWKVPSPSIYTWNAIISAQSSIDANKALGLYRKMYQVGVTPDLVTFLSILKACALIGALFKGRLIHDEVIRCGLICRAFNNSLIDMYAKCGSLEDALSIFDGLTDKNVVSWGALMAGYADCECKCSLVFELFEKMKEEGIEPNRPVFLCVLKACSLLRDMTRGHLLHCELIKVELDREPAIGNTLIDMYTKLGFLEDACRVFEKLSVRNIVSWDVRISGLVQHGHNLLALDIFKKMQQEGLKPNKYTFSNILKAFSMQGSVDDVKGLHDQLVKCSFESCIVTMNTLIDVYGKSGYICEASNVFEALQNRDIVSWGTLIASCVQHGLDHTSLAYFERMQVEGFSPNEAVYVSILKACIMVGMPLQSMILHHQIIRAGIRLDVAIGTTLINMYGKLGHIQEASKVFYTMKDMNEVTWGSMVASYVENGFCLPALKTFIKMQDEGIKPEKACFLYIFKACGQLGALESSLIHGQIIEIGLMMDVEIVSALIHMYVKCGSLSDAYKILNSFPNGNIVSWGTMIAGFARTGLYEKAGECVQTMNNLGLKPDNAIFINLLCACTNAGLLEQGCEVFSSMRESYGIEPIISHYNSLIDLLGRTGLMDEAEDLLLSMPTTSDVYGWISLLSCCKKHCNVDLASRCLVQVI